MERELGSWEMGDGDGDGMGGWVGWRLSSRPRGHTRGDILLSKVLNRGGSCCSKVHTRGDI